LLLEYTDSKWNCQRMDQNFTCSTVPVYDGRKTLMLGT
jgi:hypothetical protein